MTSRVVPFRRIAADGSDDVIERPLAIEMPVAFEINGLGYAVMMATPQSLTDFAVGFCLAERLIDRGEQFLEAVPFETDNGILLRVTLDAALGERVLERVRHRIAESSCGLCGIESLEQALRPLARVPAALAPAPQAIFAALGGLREHQPLGRETGAAHAASLCGPDGAIRLVREDVGRHNAFDKLVGAMIRAGLGWDGGFALTTARLSYELVEKAALAGCPTLAAISAPTSLAIDRAAEAGVRIFALARPDAILEALVPAE